ncbi:MAG: hypothetical protein A2Y65_09155 [Deltaproteobacteria bacterium RBG_13_52_11]|nr:MAG: hypothetical protein A2Y65_09155 [Deltaproteobacteria bacterium RBG_13_52_11]
MVNIRKKLTLLLTAVIILATNSSALSYKGDIIKDYCVAQTDSLPDGHGGGSQFPGKMTRAECEKKCQPIYSKVIEYDVWGYCRFGDNDYIWEYKHGGENRLKESEKKSRQKDVDNSFSITSHSAGFDCSKAGTRVEKLICQDTELSELDSRMSDAYEQALMHTNEPSQLKEQQRRWLRDTRDRCSDPSCLKSAYTQRIGQLSAKSTWMTTDALLANRKFKKIASRDITETRVTSLAVTSDGTCIITGDENGSIKIWKKDDLSMLLAIPGHQFRTSQVIVSPDDRYIVSYSNSDDDINVWELPSGRLAHTYRLGGLDQKIIFNKKGTLLLIANTSEIMAMPFEIGKRYSVTTRDEAMWSMKVADTSQYLNNAVLSPDKEVLATALNEGKELIVHLWKCSQGTWGTKAEIQKIKTIRQEKKKDDRINQVAFTHDGRYLLAGTQRGLVYVYDISRDPPKLVRTIETRSNSNMYSLIVTGDDTTIITSGGTNNWNGEDGAGVIEVWDLKTGARIHKLGKLGSFPLVALQGNSLILAKYRSFWVEDIKTGKMTLMQPKQRAGSVSTLAISKSKTVMVSAGWDNRIVDIWSIPSFKLKMSIPTRHDYHTARISPDDKSVVLGSSDGTIVVMDLQSGRIIHEIQALPNFTPGIHSVFVSPDGKYIISEKPRVKKIFKMSDGKEVTDNSDCNIPLGEVIAQSAKDYIVANKVNNNNYEIAVYNAAERALQEVNLSPYSYELNDHALLSPDGQYAYFALHTGIDKPGAIIQFSRQADKKIRETETASCCVMAVSQNYLISGGDDKRAVVWDIATGKQICRLYGHQDVISAIQIVDDVAITAAFDGQIFVWSLPEGKLKKILRHQ